MVEVAAQYDGVYFSQTELISVVEAFENYKSKVLDRESLMMQSVDKHRQVFNMANHGMHNEVRLRVYIMNCLS